MKNSDGILQDNDYSIFVPIKDHDLMKSITVDENGDYIVQGVMTAEDKDEEDDSITAEGMDCSYFLDKGWIKYEHGNNPNQFIGEPIEVKVGQFEHPTLHKLVKGIFVQGRLFAQRALAQEAVNAIQDLQKSHTKRQMGWSIEGNVKERDKKTGKIVKSILRNVVLTMNPVNTMTWAELAKSFAKNHELTIDMEEDKPIAKAMNVDSIAAIDTQSIEGYKPSEPKEDDDDEQEKWVKLFREFVKNHFINKSLRTKFVTSTAGAVGMTAYEFALKQGLDNEGAFNFASDIADRHEILKSLFGTKFGGETMSKLASLLDVDLEELEKSLGFENNEDDELEKSANKNKDKKEEDKEEDDKEEDSEDDKEEDSEEDKEEDSEDDKEEDSEEDDKEEDDKGTKKSIKTDFAKSLAAGEENAKAFEVSDFLANLADEIGYNMDGFSKSMTLVTKQQNAVVKSLITMGNLMQGLSEKVESLQTENADLKKSLNDVLEKPVGRKSVVSTKEVVTLNKSMGAGKSTGALTRNQISDVLLKSFDAGEIPGTAISRFEAGVSLDRLNLPKSVLEKIGL